MRDTIFSKIYLKSIFINLNFKSKNKNNNK